jgi:hypothetical protein
VIDFTGWFDMPIRMMWIGGIFQLLGGGELMIISMLLAIVADVFSPEQR